MKTMRKVASAAAACMILAATAPLFVSAMLVYARCHGGGDIRNC